MSEDSNDDVNFSCDFDEKEELLQAITAAGLSADLVKSVSSELEETEEKDSRVIFVSSDGEIVYKAIWAPASALDGKRGPELFPGARNDVVIAVYNRDFIDELVETIENEDAGLRDEMWEDKIGELVEEVMACYADRPTTWGEFNV
jgi:hypothetical protein